MRLYILNHYDFLGEDEVCFEHEEEERVVKEALQRSLSDDGKYTYRMEVWENGVMLGGWRFFQNGKEFTSHAVTGVRGKWTH